MEPKHAWQLVKLEIFSKFEYQSVTPPEYILLHGKPASIVN